MRHAWWLVLAACGSSGSSPDASGDAVCEMDCAGVCNGSAMTDRCGVCDTDPTNDCWKGVHGLSSLTPLPDQANLGSGKLAYEVSSVAQQRGVFYGGPAMTMPAVGIAEVTATNTCGITGRGYTGVATIHALTDATSYTFDSTDGSVVFGTEGSSCSKGVLVYKQGSIYGAIRFITINADNSVDIEYWIGQAGVTDFRNAPDAPPP